MIPNLTAGADFAGLTSYLTVNRAHQVLVLRGVSSIDDAPREMEVVASASARVQKPAMHLSLSAALEDGVLNDALWLELLSEIDSEFELPDHQLIAVRHRDKDYDHIHACWCTVSPDTGKCPPKQMFRARGAPMPEREQCSLPADVVARLPADAVKKGAFNRFALSRLMTICRSFERKHSLRRLRDSKGAAAAREEGASRPARNADRHRKQRTGRLPVTEASEVIRNALDEPDYTSMRNALNKAGFDFEPVMRERKDGSVEYRGLAIVDMVDGANRAPASAFDTVSRRYGLRQIEKRRPQGTPTIETWWPTQAGREAPAETVQADPNDIYQAYQQLRDQHRRQEEERRLRRRHLAVCHAQQRLKLRRRLMKLRRLRAERLPPAQRRAFYAHFAKTTRATIWGSMERRQAVERFAVRRRAMQSWKAFAQRRLRADSFAAQAFCTATVSADCAASQKKIHATQVPIVEAPDLGADEQADADMKWLYAQHTRNKRDGR